MYAGKALEEPTFEKFIRALFSDTVAFLTTPGHPPTCMTLAGAVGCSLSATPARDLMTEIRKQNQAALRQRLLKARKSGELSKDIDLDDYTRHLSTIIAGLSIQAAVQRKRNSSGPPGWPFPSGLLSLLRPWTDPRVAPIT